MKIWSTKNEYMVFQALSGRANAYLIGRNGRYIMVDTGITSQWAQLLGTMDMLEIKEGELLGLILTHTHFDHVQNAARIREKFGLPVFVHRSEAAYLAKGESPLPDGSLVITRWLMGKMASLSSLRFPFAPVSADHIVDERIDLDYMGFGGVYILHTPGHSSGSLTVVVDDEIALVGDTMWGGFEAALFPPFADEPRRLVQNWKCLLERGCSLFLPGHGSERSLGLVKRQAQKYQHIYGLE